MHDLNKVRVVVLEMDDGVVEVARFAVFLPNDIPELGERLQHDDVAVHVPSAKLPRHCCPEQICEVGIQPIVPLQPANVAAHPDLEGRVLEHRVRVQFYNLDLATFVRKGLHETRAHCGACLSLVPLHVCVRRLLPGTRDAP